MPTIDQARTWYQDADPVHDFDHVLRVYRLAENLAQQEGADLEIVRAAVLLHDAQGSSHGQDEQARAEHHLASADFARQILSKEGWPEDKITAVQHCTRAHRFRSGETPETIEAKVVFDADKLDAIGAVGAARAIMYAVLDGAPVYQQPSDQFMQKFELAPGEAHSSYHEFLFKLSRIKGRMYTASGKAIAEARHLFLSDFYQQIAAEFRGEK